MGSSNEWIIKDGKLCKTFVFGSFLEAISFMNRASVEIEELNHHPEWTNVYNRVEVSLCTHDKGNSITDLDYKLAELLDALFNSNCL